MARGKRGVGKKKDLTPLSAARERNTKKGGGKATISKTCGHTLGG